MTISIARSRPSWRVQSVFDPDGTGKDFAYTIGLLDSGLPELHIWARPSLGEDPGEDWLLSVNDRTHVLNELAQLLIDGQLDIGTTVTREYDAGLATVTFEVAPPGDKEELEAYGVGPGALVLPVLWSLRRPAEGPTAAITEAAEAVARAAYEELVDGLDKGRRPPRGWTLPATPSFATEQPFGPLTPVVLARAAQLWQSSDESLEQLLYMASCVDSAGRLTMPTIVASAAARPVGRRGALEVLHSAVHDLVEQVSESPPMQRRWRSAVCGVFPDIWQELSRDGKQIAEHNFARMLHHLTRDCLSVEATADVTSRDVQLEARGPWLAGIRGETVLSLPEWHASPVVLATVRGLLANLGADELAEIASVHHRNRLSSEDYRDVTIRLQTWAVTSAASCPWHQVLSDLTSRKPLAVVARTRSNRVIRDLEHWATCVTAAITHGRERLSRDDVDLLAAPFRTLVPGLRAVLQARR